MDEEDQLKFGFDLFDPTKIVPEELVPITPLGKLTLNRNPTNYFAETEQVMFQPAHLVRGVDFTEDPLLQGRVFSYLDTQLNRHGGPNFEQLPINRPRVPIHNNNRDGAAQMIIPANNAAYSPNTLNNGSPKQATQREGRGFFTAPKRTASGPLVRGVSDTLSEDYWSQPRLFFNSLLPQEQQFLINAIRFETSNLKSATVKKNVLTQLNKVSSDLASRVATALGMTAPAPDDTFYHNKTTKSVSVFKSGLKKIDGLKVGMLTSVDAVSNANIVELKATLSKSGVDLMVVAEHLMDGVDMTYSAADATAFDGVVIADGAESLFGSRTRDAGPPGPIPSGFVRKRQASSSRGSKATLYPAGRPAQILVDSFNWGKPIGAMGDAGSVFAELDIGGAGVYGGVVEDVAGGRNGTGGGAAFSAQNFMQGLKTFKFLERFPVDE